MDVQTRIRDILSESLQDDGEGGGPEFGEMELLDAVRQRGLVEEIMERLEIGEGRGNVRSKVVGQPSRGRVKPATHFLDKEAPVTTVPLKKGL